jgi:mannosylglycerate hydrolase
MEPAQVGPHGGDLPKKQSFLSVEPANLILSALKRSEDGEGLVLRLFNPTEKTLSGTVKTFRRIRAAHSVTLEEEPVRKLTPKGSSLRMKVPKKKIVTLKLTL